MSTWCREVVKNGHNLVNTPHARNRNYKKLKICETKKYVLFKKSYKKVANSKLLNRLQLTKTRKNKAKYQIIFNKEIPPQDLVKNTLVKS